MEFHGFRVVEVNVRLRALLTCLDERGVTVTGAAERPEDIQTNDILEVVGDRDGVLRRLDACDPDWGDYLCPA